MVFVPEDVTKFIFMSHKAVSRHERDLLSESERTLSFMDHASFSIENQREQCTMSQMVPWKQLAEIDPFYSVSFCLTSSITITM